MQCSILHTINKHIKKMNLQEYIYVQKITIIMKLNINEESGNVLKLSYL